MNEVSYNYANSIAFFQICRKFKYKLFSNWFCFFEYLSEKELMKRQSNRERGQNIKESKNMIIDYGDVIINNPGKRICIWFVQRYKNESDITIIIITMK